MPDFMVQQYLVSFYAMAGCLCTLQGTSPEAATPCDNSHGGSSSHHALNAASPASVKMHKPALGRRKAKGFYPEATF